MVVHHLMREKDLKNSCPYCHTDLSANDWRSDFSQHKHYKITTCGSCQKNISMKMTFNGSGHDCWHFESDFAKRINCKTRLSRLEQMAGHHH